VRNRHYLLSSMILAVILTVLSATPSSAGTIYVDINAPGPTHDGSSWADAFNYLQDALTAAVSGDDIWVAEGTYYPSVEVGGTGDRYKTFQLKHGVAIYGGFPTDGDTFANRDPSQYETILSGDIGVSSDNSDNCYHVFYHLGTNLDSTAVLDGFTITGGNANGPGGSRLGCGAGMLNWSHNNPTVTNCTFSDNSAYQGGGMYNYYDCSPIVTNCTFSRNSSSRYGGGMSNGGGRPVITNCIFSGNSASVGGGIYNWNNSRPTVTNCILWDNTATSGGSEIYNDLRYPNTTSVISYCDIAGCFPSGSWDTSLGSDGGGNIDADPLFADADDDNLRLQAGSPCIDAGDNSVVTGATDLDGRPRIIDGDGNGTATVDMGAYEMRVIYVDVDATGDDNGSSWSNAFDDLQEALSIAVSGREIWVAAGTYYPTTEVGGTGPRYQTFQMINGVAIYGGFVGTETALAQRDMQNNETILSGDIGTADDPTDNCYHVFYHPSGTSLDAAAILDGFTITAGNANGSNPHYYGGGVYNLNSGPTVNNCTFSDNLAKYGGGMFNDKSNPTVTGCTFSKNSAYDSAGGMYNSLYSSPIVANCTFTANSANWGGGGMLNGSSSSTTVTNCTFIGNSSERHGGGMWNTNVTSLKLSNCTFTGNSADIYGGGMVNNKSSPTVTNCTFIGNSSEGYSGGIYNWNNSSPTVTNCILWGNVNSGGINESAQIMGGSLTINYSCIQGLTGNLGGTGNIGSNPEFVFPGYWNPNGTPGNPNDDFWVEGDYYLQPTSPCVDAGDPNFIALQETDLAGNPRIVNGIVDMGAYEYWKYSRNPADLDGDGVVDYRDFVIFSSNWMAENCSLSSWCGGCDLNHSGKVDSIDLFMVARSWLWQMETALDIDLDLDDLWMYQNLPGQNDSYLTAAISIEYDPLDNTSYTYEWEFILPDDVSIAPASVDAGGATDEFWIFAAPGCDEPCGISDLGEAFTVRVTVVGNHYGNSPISEAQFGIALLGDVNNDAVVNESDRGFINTFWRAGSAGSFTLRDCDVNCDGVVNVADR